MKMSNAAKLITLSNNGDDGIVFEPDLSQKYINIGSDINCDIRLINAKKLHAKITLLNADKSIILTNYSKTNPVKINNQIIKTEIIIKHNDLIEILDKKLRWEFEEKTTNTNNKNICVDEVTKVLTPSTKIILTKTPKTEPVKSKNNFSKLKLTNSSVINARKLNLMSDKRVTYHKVLGKDNNTHNTIIETNEEEIDNKFDENVSPSTKIDSDYPMFEKHRMPIHASTPMCSNIAIKNDFKKKLNKLNNSGTLILSYASCNENDSLTSVTPKKNLSTRTGISRTRTPRSIYGTPKSQLSTVNTSSVILIDDTVGSQSAFFKLRDKTPVDLINFSKTCTSATDETLVSLDESLVSYRTPDITSSMYLIDLKTPGTALKPLLKTPSKTPFKNNTSLIKSALKNLSKSTAKIAAKNTAKNKLTFEDKISTNNTSSNKNTSAIKINQSSVKSSPRLSVSLNRYSNNRDKSPMINKTNKSDFIVINDSINDTHEIKNSNSIQSEMDSEIIFINDSKNETGDKDETIKENVIKSTDTTEMENSKIQSDTTEVIDDSQVLNRTFEITNNIMETENVNDDVPHNKSEKVNEVEAMDVTEELNRTFEIKTKSFSNDSKDLVTNNETLNKSNTSVEAEIVDETTKCSLPEEESMTEVVENKDAEVLDETVDFKNKTNVQSNEENKSLLEKADNELKELPENVEECQIKKDITKIIEEPENELEENGVEIKNKSIVAAVESELFNESQKSFIEKSVNEDEEINLDLDISIRKEDVKESVTTVLEQPLKIDNMAIEKTVESKIINESIECLLNEDDSVSIEIPDELNIYTEEELLNENDSVVTENEITVTSSTEHIESTKKLEKPFENDNKSSSVEPEINAQKCLLDKTKEDNLESILDEEPLSEEFSVDIDESENEIVVKSSEEFMEEDTDDLKETVEIENKSTVSTVESESLNESKKYLLAKVSTQNKEILDDLDNLDNLLEEGDLIRDSSVIIDESENDILPKDDTESLKECDEFVENKSFNNTIELEAEIIDENVNVAQITVKSLSDNLNSTLEEGQLTSSLNDNESINKEVAIDSALLNQSSKIDQTLINAETEALEISEEEHSVVVNASNNDFTEEIEPIEIMQIELEFTDETKQCSLEKVVNEDNADNLDNLNSIGEEGQVVDDRNESNNDIFEKSITEVAVDEIVPNKNKSFITVGTENLDKDLKESMVIDESENDIVDQDVTEVFEQTVEIENNDFVETKLELLNESNSNSKTIGEDSTIVKNITENFDSTVEEGQLSVSIVDQSDIEKEIKELNILKALCELKDFESADETESSIIEDTGIPNNEVLPNPEELDNNIVEKQNVSAVLQESEESKDNTVVQGGTDDIEIKCMNNTVETDKVAINDMENLDYSDNEIEESSTSLNVNNETNYVGLKEIMNTPKCSNNLDDMRGVKEIFNTPHKNELSDLVGVKETMKTPANCKNPNVNLAGIKNIFKTPKDPNNLTMFDGIRELVKTPKDPNNLTMFDGVRELVKTPKDPNNLTMFDGVRELVKTPKISNETLNMSGINEMMKTPSCHSNDNENKTLNEKSKFKNNLYKTAIMSHQVSLMDKINKLDDERMTVEDVCESKDLELSTANKSEVSENQSTNDKDKSTTNELVEEINSTSHNNTSLKTPNISIMIDTSGRKISLSKSKTEIFAIEPDILPETDEESPDENEDNEEVPDPIEIITEVNKSAENLFDEFVGKPLLKYTYSRNNSSPKKQSIPTDNNISIDLPKTDIELWINSVSSSTPQSKVIKPSFFEKRTNPTTQVLSSFYSNVTTSKNETSIINNLNETPEKIISEDVLENSSIGNISSKIYSSEEEDMKNESLDEIKRESLEENKKEKMIENKMKEKEVSAATPVRSQRIREKKLEKSVEPVKVLPSRKIKQGKIEKAADETTQNSESPPKQKNIEKLNVIMESVDEKINKSDLKEEKKTAISDNEEDTTAVPIKRANRKKANTTDKELIKIDEKMNKSDLKEEKKTAISDNEEDTTAVPIKRANRKKANTTDKELIKINTSDESEKLVKETSTQQVKRNIRKRPIKEPNIPEDAPEEKKRQTANKTNRNELKADYLESSVKVVKDKTQNDPKESPNSKGKEIKIVISRVKISTPDEKVRKSIEESSPIQTLTNKNVKFVISDTSVIETPAKILEAKEVPQKRQTARQKRILAEAAEQKKAEVTTEIINDVPSPPKRKTSRKKAAIIEEIVEDVKEVNEEKVKSDEEVPLPPKKNSRRKVVVKVEPTKEETENIPVIRKESKRKMKITEETVVEIEKAEAPSVTIIEEEKPIEQQLPKRNARQRKIAKVSPVKLEAKEIPEEIIVKTEESSEKRRKAATKKMGAEISVAEQSTPKGRPKRQKLVSISELSDKNDLIKSKNLEKEKINVENVKPDTVSAVKGRGRPRLASYQEDKMTPRSINIETKNSSVKKIERKTKKEILDVEDTAVTDTVPPASTRTVRNRKAIRYGSPVDSTVREIERDLEDITWSIEKEKSGSLKRKPVIKQPTPIQVNKEESQIVAKGRTQRKLTKRKIIDDDDSPKEDKSSEETSEKENKKTKKSKEKVLSEDETEKEVNVKKLPKRQLKGKKEKANNSKVMKTEEQKDESISKVMKEEIALGVVEKKGRSSNSKVAKEDISIDVKPMAAKKKSTKSNEKNQSTTIENAEVLTSGRVTRSRHK